MQGGFFDTPMSEVQREEMQMSSQSMSRAVSAAQQAAEQKRMQSKGCFTRGFFKGVSMGLMAYTGTMSRQKQQTQQSTVRQVDFTPMDDKSAGMDTGYSM